MFLKIKFKENQEKVKLDKKKTDSKMVDLIKLHMCVYIHTHTHIYIKLIITKTLMVKIYQLKAVLED